MNGVLPRQGWSGKARRVGTYFTLVKPGMMFATCELWTHWAGWELRLYVRNAAAHEELAQSKVCRAEQDVFDTGDRWKAEMQTKGWS